MKQLTRRPAQKLRVSFEFFPPANARMEETLWASVERLAPLAPDFISVTYGAGGSTRERTLSTVSRIATETTVPVAGHLTCVGASRAEVDAVIADYKAAGVKRIVALRGDPAEGVGHAYVARPDGYANAAELCGAISALGSRIEARMCARPR